MNPTLLSASPTSARHTRHRLPTFAGLALAGVVLMLSNRAALAEPNSEPAYCANHREECAAAAERLKQRCADDPAACEKARTRLQDLKARCDADPAACEQKKEQLRERREALKARCDADPTACEEKKREFRDRLKERRDAKLSPAGQTPPIIPPKPDR